VPADQETTAHLEAAARERRRKQKRSDQIAGFAYPVATMLAIICVWEAATHLFSIRPYLLPAPSVIATSMAANAGALLKHSAITASEITLGFLLSVIVGVPLAMALFLSKSLARAIYPVMISVQAVPKVAIAPLFLVWFGFNLLPKVLIAFFIAFFPIVINTAVGLASIEREKLYLARSMGLSGVATFWKIQLPNALPSMFAGFKISITFAVVGAVVGEFVGGQGGLGYLLLTANGNMDTALLFAGIVALTILGLLFFAVIVLIERLSLPPHAVERASLSTEMM
jgi:NitT/TauT family transport system permease protein